MHVFDSTTKGQYYKSFVGPVLADWPVGLRYAVALSLITVIAVGRHALVPVLGVQAPLLPFVFAVFATALLGGLGPAMLATVASSVIATVLYADANDGPSLFAWSAHVALFVLLACLVALLTHRLQTAYRSQSEALRAVTAAEKRLRTITDAMPALIAYVDSEYRYGFTNRTYCEWFKLAEDQIRGIHVRDVLGEKAYAAIRPHMELVLSGRTVDFEADVPYGGGTRHVKASYVPDRSHDGAVRGYFALVHDMTEQARRSQELSDERLWLSLAMQVGQIGAFEWVVDQNRNHWSHELLELYGFRFSEFEGSREAWLQRVHPDDLQYAENLFNRVLNSDELEFEFRIRRNDTGETRWIQGRTKTLRNAMNQPTRVVGVNIDITERKRIEEALRESDHRKDQFIATLAHELRNPLAPISNIAHLLTDERTDLPTLRQYGGMIQRQVTTLSRLVDDLLDAARLRRGAIPIKREPVELSTLVQHSIETVRPMFHAKEQGLNVASSAASVTLYGDGVRLEQALVNLLTNASKFSARGSHVDVVVATAGDEVVVSVRDYGQGIDSRLLPQVFELFVQGDQEMSRPHGGLGIGLSLVKGIVEQHGGTVFARSGGLGLGSEFTMVLPRDPESSITAASA